MKKSILALAAAFAVALSLACAPCALAEEPAGSVSIEIGIDAPDTGDVEGEALVEGYIGERAKLAPDPVVSRISALSVRAVHTSRSRLSGYPAALYDELKPLVTSVAAGELDNTRFTVDLDGIIAAGGLEERYSASDLGVEWVYRPDEGMSPAAKGAVNDMISAGLDEALAALMQDLPYELYWFDKVRGVTSSCGFGVEGSAARGYYVVLSGGQLNLGFHVSADYSADGTAGTLYARDLTPVKAAAEEAARIVAAHAGEGDLAKLDSYRAEVCAMTSYDNDAAADATRPYGDPWQLISVFDGNPNTKVVCEGYSKAFKLLCDYSSFANRTVACYTATGWLQVGSDGGGAHMWNIVTADGKSYLADVTNCDEGMAGGRLTVDDGIMSLAAGAGLFMRGRDGVLPVADRPDLASSGYADGFSVHLAAQQVDKYSTSAKDVGYYYRTGISTLYPDQATELSESDCAEIADQCDHKMERIAEVPATCEKNGVAAYWHCTVCGGDFADAEGDEDAGDLALPALGHSWGDWFVSERPTLEAEGVMSRVCARESSHHEDAPIPALVPVAVPVAVPGLVYTGVEQDGVLAGDGCSLSGSRAIHAGEYTAVASLADKERTAWADGTVEDKPVTYSIGKATLTATYPGETIDAGQAPALVVEVTGFVGGEDAGSALGYSAPSVSAPPALASGRSYELTPSGGTAGDYAFRYVAGTLSVKAKAANQGTGSLTAAPLPAGLTDGSGPAGQDADASPQTGTLVIDKVASIGKAAYKGTAAKKVVVGDKVKSVGASAFANAGNLTSLTLGKNVRSVGKKALSGAKKLKVLTLRTTKLTKASCKRMLTGSSVRTIKLTGMSKSAKAKALKKYRAWFPKKVAGKKLTVK